jgi:excinuclease ABC subunit C
METLRLKGVPEHIEGFDISHMHGTGTVASMVVFKRGKPFRSSYRKFRIRNATNDDYTAMREVVGRRYRRLIDQDDPFPDLILIDGGKGQLNAALKALEELELEEMPNMVSIAKKEEELFLPDRELPVKLKRSDPSLRLLQNVRDEAHRFAVAYQRKLRRNEVSLLVNVEGVGKKRARELLMAFESLNDMLEAGHEEIIGRTTIPRNVSLNVIEYLKKNIKRG